MTLTWAGASAGRGRSGVAITASFFEPGALHNLRGTIGGAELGGRQVGWLGACHSLKPSVTKV